MSKEEIVQEHGFFYGMSWFQAFRNDYGFTAYRDNRTPVTIDFPLVTIIYLCVVLGAATLVSTLGIRGRERWATTLRAIYGVGLLSIILVCLVGHNWLEGETEIVTHYLYRSDNYFRGKVGLRIALDGCNITLNGYYEGLQTKGYVNYVETILWKDYGHEQENLGGPLARGLPHPVLAVMDFLSVDSGGMRWGRNLHSAGYFAMALLWTALVFWVICQVLLVSVVSYGSFMMIMTGTAMVLSTVVYHVSQPPLELRVHLGQGVLTLAYGWCFWLTLAAGIVTWILGIMLFFVDHVFHQKVSEFFNLDKLDEDDTNLPEYTAYSKKNSVSDKQVFSPRSSGSILTQGRRASLQFMGGNGRKNSIFLEPERRPSDYGSVLRSGKNVGFTSGPAANGQAIFSVSSLVAGGFTSKGFEQDLQRTKSNPLFSGHCSDDIEEVPEDAASEARIDIPDDDDEKKDAVTSRKDRADSHGDHKAEDHHHDDVDQHHTSLPTSAGLSSRKPSQAAWRPQSEEENPDHERLQHAAVSTTSSSASLLSVVQLEQPDELGNAAVSSSRKRSDLSSPRSRNALQSDCTTILIHSYRALQEDEVSPPRKAMTSSSDDVTGYGLAGFGGGNVESDDSAFASCSPSPSQSLHSVMSGK